MSANRIETQRVDLGNVGRYLSDPLVTDVLINGPGSIWVDRAGELIETNSRVNEQELLDLIDRLVGPTGFRVDRSQPIADARLANGTRVCVVLPPVAPHGPIVALRAFPTSIFGLDELACNSYKQVLEEALAKRTNIVVYGSTGSGKTTLLNTLGSAIPESKRIVIIEDTAELRLEHPHVLSLEARKENTEGVGAVTTEELVRASLRLRPDYLVVGEVRGSEAFDMIWAMSTGHRGSMSTIHAADAQGARERLIALCLSRGNGLGYEVVSQHVDSAVQLWVGMAKRDDGSRWVRCIDVFDGQGWSQVTAESSLQHTTSIHRDSSCT